MKSFVSLLFFLIAFLSFASTASSGIYLDISQSICEITSPTTFKIHYFTIPGINGRGLAEFQWDAENLFFYPINADFDFGCILHDTKHDNQFY
jgi:hypothetical protein